MNATAPHRLGRLLAVVGAALTTACADRTALGPDRGAAFDAQPAHESPAAAAPALGDCDYLRAPAGSAFAFHVYARGVQIYRWNGTSWAPVGPSAELFADAESKALVGIHYAGPYWESLSGSRVKGTVIDRCVADPDAIPWLSLSGTAEGGPGVFQHVTFIQRVNTVGGKAPSGSGTLDEVREVAYAAEYYFYRTP